MVSIASVEAFLTRSQITFGGRPRPKALSLKSECLDAITQSWRRANFQISRTSLRRRTVEQDGRRSRLTGARPVSNGSSRCALTSRPGASIAPSRHFGTSSIGRRSRRRCSRRDPPQTAAGCRDLVRHRHPLRVRAAASTSTSGRSQIALMEDVRQGRCGKFVASRGSADELRQHHRDRRVRLVVGWRVHGAGDQLPV
jgi:hypothetical protein